MIGVGKRVEVAAEAVAVDDFDIQTLVFDGYDGIATDTEICSYYYNRKRLTVYERIVFIILPGFGITTG
jgi:hypothetical protein